MLSLSLYSSSTSVSLVLAKNKDILKFLEYKDNKKIKTDKLFSLLYNLSKKENITSLEEIIISRGPGGFTSIRSLISIAQGLSLNSNARILSVTMFEAFLCDLDISNSPTIIFFKDSRKDFYYQFYMFEEKKWIKKSKIYSGTYSQIENKISLFMKKRKIREITIVSNFFDQNFNNIVGKKLLKIEVNAKSIFSSLIKNYASKTLKPIYHHPHYAKKNKI